MLFLVNFFLVILVTYSTLGVNAQFDSSCVTPNGETGVCKEFFQCAPILQIIKTKKKAEYIDFLRQSICGTQYGFICCGTFGEFIKPTNNNGNIGTPNDQYDYGEYVNANYNNGNSGRPTPNNYPDYDYNEGNRRPTVGNNRNGGSLFPGREVCGTSIGDRILNGEKTELGEFPWMALLEYRGRTGRLSHNCGGTLISDRYVLTAAHCVVGEIEKVVGKLNRVRLGEHDVSTNPECLEDGECAEYQDIVVEEAFAHEGYNEKDQNRHNDVALVRLAVPVNFTNFIQPICLPQEGDRVPNSYFVAGWGQTETGRNSNVMLKLKVPAYPLERCFMRFKQFRVSVDDTQLCAGGEKNKDSCRGDSGGPLMFQTDGVWVIAGVVSYGAKCGSEDIPGVYTKVSKYMDWITQNVKA